MQQQSRVVVLAGNSNNARGIYKVGGKEISRVAEVGEMVMQEKVQCRQVGKLPVTMIRLSVMLFRARLRQKHLTERSYVLFWSVTRSLTCYLISVLLIFMNLYVLPQHFL